MSIGLVELLILIGIVAVVFGAVIAAMAIGVIVSNRRIQGSCGGLSTMRGDSPCMVCGDAPRNCDEAQKSACATVSGGERFCEKTGFCPDDAPTCSGSSRTDA